MHLSIYSVGNRMLNIQSYKYVVYIGLLLNMINAIDEKLTSNLIHSISKHKSMHFSSHSRRGMIY